MPKRRRVSSVRHYCQTSASVKANRHHCGVMRAQFCSNPLFKVEQVPTDEFPELLAEYRHCLSVAADIGKRDALQLGQTDTK